MMFIFPNHFVDSTKKKIDILLIILNDPSEIYIEQNLYVERF